MSNKLLVTGAAGQLGQRVIHHLLETYKVAPADIVAATRSPEKLSDLAAKGVVTRKADFDDAVTLADAFAGIDRLLIISTDSLDTPGKRLAQHKAAIEAAKKAGVKHILYTSMPSPDNSLVTFAPDHLGTEQAIQASGITYTILRDAWYMDNFMLSLPHNLQVGSWYTAAHGGRAPYISREDCALAIAAALASSSTGNATYTLTGARSLSIEDIAATVAEIVGKPPQVINVTDEQLAAGLTGAGLPKFVVDMLVSADANIRAGNFDVVSGDFKTLTGREPQTLKSFLEERKAVLAG
ncbi:SDR family oxidoreductase [Rhizobium sp. BK376]|uniref:SDR family oxidoreductase n=1 Tax=Rhizobium sp. BK376 TaxID=2512149 RepID=UPI00104CFFF5|nr:SDR family oxidoreductase [Rhizobium sp. BK376]TCR83571.1 NAD(P)H dehydrogenase (quinone) [Rhizobium sp. BK376]